MDSARKIELQAPEDLAYLVANVRRAATARIDEAFPPVDDSAEDELRTRIEEHVNEVRYLLFFFSCFLFLSCFIFVCASFEIVLFKIHTSQIPYSPSLLQRKSLGMRYRMDDGCEWMDGWMAEDLPLNI